jgi:hypothetical protein
MEKEFIPYKQALALKELGFEEPCLNYYSTPNHPSLQPFILLGINPSDPLMSGQMYKIGVWNIEAPLYQQAFRWFREKYGLKIGIDVWANNYEKWWYCIYSKKNGEWDILLENNNIEFYEEAELECLKKLIEIAKEQK